MKTKQELAEEVRKALAGFVVPTEDLLLLEWFEDAMQKKAARLFMSGVSIRNLSEKDAAPFLLAREVREAVTD